MSYTTIFDEEGNVVEPGSERSWTSAANFLDPVHWTEIGTCMKCGDWAYLVESRDGDGAHACKYGCGNSHVEREEK